MQCTIPKSWFTNKNAPGQTPKSYMKELLARAVREYPHNMSPQQQAATKAVIVPHAGWYYSGLCAASTYNVLLRNGKTPARKDIETVVMLCTFHESLDGIYAPDVQSITSITGGESVVDLRKTKFAAKMVPWQRLANEHSIHVNLPWVQLCFPHSRIVPLYVGQIRDYQETVKRLNDIDNDKTFWVINTDLVHSSPDHFPVRSMDDMHHLNSMFSNVITMKGDVMKYMIENKRYGHQPTVCGINAIKLLYGLKWFKATDAKLMSYYTSNEVERQNLAKDYYIVGYLGLAFLKKNTRIKNMANILSRFEEKQMLGLVREVIASQNPNAIPTFLSPFYMVRSGVFVTLKKDGVLRGCVGTWDQRNSILDNMKRYAYASAYLDNRFRPVQQDELSSILYSITLLGKKHSTTLKTWKIGIDGIIVCTRDGEEKTIFLPQVAVEQDWDKEETIAALLEKARMPSNSTYKLLAIPGHEII